MNDEFKKQINQSPIILNKIKEVISINFEVAFLFYQVTT